MSKKILSSISKGLKKHSPEILTGIGVAGMIGTVIMAVKATPKAVILLEQKKEQDQTEKLTFVDTVKTAGFCYIPTAITGVLSAACIIGASSINHKRNAALATIYALSETAFSEYKDKVVEIIGEKKEQTVKNEVLKDKVNDNPVSKNEVVLTEKGDTLCYEPLSGRYFKTDIDKLKKSENEINKIMLNSDYISLNDFYDEIGLKHIGIGDELGWSMSATGYINMRFSSMLADDGTPCLVIDFSKGPVYNFDI